MKALLMLNFIIPLVMLLMGCLLKRNPQAEIGHNGYSTPSSRKSQERWDYAQSVAPGVFISFGKVLLVLVFLLSAVFLFVPVDVDKAVTIGNIIGFSALALCFFAVECKIKAHFDNNK